MSDVEKQRELYTRMVATHRDMRACIADYEEWASVHEIDELVAASLEFGRITLRFGGEIME